jgi:hypothetical protein
MMVPQRLAMRLYKLGNLAQQLAPLAVLAEFAPGIYAESDLAPLGGEDLSATLNALEQTLLNPTGHETPGYRSLTPAPSLRQAKGRTSLGVTEFSKAALPTLQALLTTRDLPNLLASKIWLAERLAARRQASGGKAPFRTTKVGPTKAALAEAKSARDAMDVKSEMQKMGRSKDLIRVLVATRLIYRLKKLGPLESRLAPLVILAEMSPGEYSREELTTISGGPLGPCLTILEDGILLPTRLRPGYYLLRSKPAARKANGTTHDQSVDFPVKILPALQLLLKSRKAPELRTTYYRPRGESTRQQNFEFEAAAKVFAAAQTSSVVDGITTLLYRGVQLQFAAATESSRVMVPRSIYYRLRKADSLAEGVAQSLAPLMILGELAPGLYTENELLPLGNGQLTAYLHVLGLGMWPDNGKNEAGQYQIGQVSGGRVNFSPTHLTGIEIAATVLPFLQQLLVSRNRPKLIKPLSTGYALDTKANKPALVEAMPEEVVAPEAVAEIVVEAPTQAKKPWGVEYIERITKPSPVEMEITEVAAAPEVVTPEVVTPEVVAEVVAAPQVSIPAQLPTAVYVRAEDQPAVDMRTYQAHSITPVAGADILSDDWSKVYSVVGPNGMVHRDGQFLSLSYNDAQVVARSESLKNGGPYSVLRAIWVVNVSAEREATPA